LSAAVLYPTGCFTWPATCYHTTTVCKGLEHTLLPRQVCALCSYSSRTSLLCEAVPELRNLGADGRPTITFVAYRSSLNTWQVS
jgi:hypothetical protein